MGEADGEPVARRFGQHVGLERHLADVLLPHIARSDQRIGGGKAHHVDAVAAPERGEHQVAAGIDHRRGLVIAGGEELVGIHGGVEQSAGQAVRAARAIGDELAVFRLVGDLAAGHHWRAVLVA